MWSGHILISSSLAAALAINEIIRYVVKDRGAGRQRWGLLKKSIGTMIQCDFGAADVRDAMEALGLW